MSPLSSVSDAELERRLPALIQIERHAMVDVIEHLVEIERRRLYLSSRLPSLYRYCMVRLGYDKHAAMKRNRVAKLALRLPQALAELRAGTMRLTGLFLLSEYLREDNACTVLDEARGKTRRQIEELVARRFPRPDAPSSVEVVTSNPSCSRATHSGPAHLEPLSPSRLRVEFTARAELYDKVDKARELLSHAIPSGDLGELFERALDALIEQEKRKRFGAGKPRKARGLKPGSRHVPAAIARAVWERDESRCTFVDGEGDRCTERRFLTLEHRTPFAHGGPPTLENLCLLCQAHNLESARQVFGEAAIEAKIRERKQAPNVAKNEMRAQSPEPLPVAVQVLSSLCSLGFQRSEASTAIGQTLGGGPAADAERLLRDCLLLLVPRAS